MTLTDITPDDSVSPVFRGPDPDRSDSEGLPSPREEMDAYLEMKDSAVQKLMTEFNFSEDVARAVVGVS